MEHFFFSNTKTSSADRFYKQKNDFTKTVILIINELNFAD